jgi:linoleoyl-CoA desaturase
MELTGANSYMYSKKHLEAHFNKENGRLVNNITLQGLLLQKKEEESTVNLPYIFYVFYAQYMLFVRDFFLFKEISETIPFSEYFKLWLGKLLYASCFLVLPFIVIPLPWWQTLLAILLMYFTITVLLVIILLMPTEKMTSNKVLDSSDANEQWLVEILAHNVDFSPTSKFLNCMVGGANLNVVHYIFPGASHVHYNSLATIIEETANEFGLLYRKQEVKDVFGIHFTYLKNIQNTATDV